MVIINEILPNPRGQDAEGEWVELFNDSGERVDLDGWAMKDRSGREFNLDGLTMEAGGYLVLPYSQTRIILNNTDERLELYREGRLVDWVEMVGGAGEGVSWVRVGTGWQTAVPTPGMVNTVADEKWLGESSGEAGGEVINWAEVLGGGVILGILAAVMMIYIWRVLNRDQAGWETQETNEGK